MHDFIVKRAVDFLQDLPLHSLRAPAKNARHFYSCFQARILPPNFLTGSLNPSKLRHISQGLISRARGEDSRAGSSRQNPRGTTPTPALPHDCIVPQCRPMVAFQARKMRSLTCQHSTTRTVP